MKPVFKLLICAMFAAAFFVFYLSLPSEAKELESQLIEMERQHKENEYVRQFKLELANEVDWSNPKEAHAAIDSLSEEMRKIYGKGQAEVLADK
jgi:hypothetical protein